MNIKFRKQFANATLCCLCIFMLVSLIASQLLKATPVLAAGSEPSTVTIVSDIPDPSLVEQEVVVSVTVTGESGTPTGTVDISGANPNTNCSFPLVNGSGSCIVRFSYTGKRTLTASYSGDGTYAANVDTETHAVPTLVVSQKSDFVSVYDWPLGETISVGINDTAFVSPAPIVVDEGIENIFLGFDIKPGQTVTVTGTRPGGTTTLTHRVLDFKITQVDFDNATISGTSNNDSLPIILLFLSSGNQACNRTVSATDGIWTADVSKADADKGEIVCDMPTDSFGEIRQQAPDGHATVDDWNGYTEPAITEGASTSVTMNKNGSPTAFDLTLHATDVDADDILTWSIGTPAGHGIASASGTGNSKAINYTPDNNYIGSDSFVVQVDDSHGRTDTITVNVNITSPACQNVTQIPMAECNALVALYNSTNGADWTNHTNWLQINTPCSWNGVSCVDGHVTGINMFLNNLSGVIPPELSSLTNLTGLDLHSNQLNGSIPPELGSLTNLTSLDLGWNQLSDSIPSELGSLTNLAWLSLYGNQLSGSIPPELDDLTNLTYLDWVAIN
jgi:hypothetical protein